MVLLSQLTLKLSCQQISRVRSLFLTGSNEFTKSHADFGIGPRRQITFPMFGDGIFTQEGEAWKHSRNLLRPQFTHEQYNNLTVFRNAVDSLLSVITADTSSDGVIDLQPLFFRLTLDTTTTFLFGNSVNSLKATGLNGPGLIREEPFTCAFNTAQEYIAKRYRLLDFYWLIGGTKFTNACSTVHQFASQIINKNLAKDVQYNKSREYIFLRSLAEEIPDRDALRGQIINMLVAGRDTTACLLTWTLYVLWSRLLISFSHRHSSFSLVRYPRVFRKLRAEVTAACNKDSSLTRTDLRNMKYLQNVLKESRLLLLPKHKSISAN